MIVNRVKSGIFRCWESADSSRKARYNAIPDHLKEENIHEARNNNSAFIRACKELYDAGETSFQNIIAKVSKELGAAEEKRLAAVKEGERIMVSHLMAGRFRTFAFEEPRSLKGDPVELDWRFLIGNPTFDWNAGRLQKDSLRFVEIRMLEDYRAEWCLNADLPPDQRRLSVGDMVRADLELKEVQAQLPDLNPVRRPAVTHFITDAVTDLQRTGQIDVRKSMKSHYPLIRLWLAQNTPEMNVTDTSPGDEVIRRVLSPHFKAQKQKTQKL